MPYRDRSKWASTTPYGPEDDTFSGSGFTCYDGESGLKLHVERVYQCEVAYV